MPEPTPLSRHGRPIEDRFLSWVDALVDPAPGDPPAPDPDLTELADTARRVHASAGATATALPTDREAAIWEEIMQTTTTAQPTPAPIPRDERAAPPLIRPKTDSPGWRSVLATAALLLLIAAAAIAAIWRIAGPFDLGGGGNGSNETARQPGIAGPATPATATAEGCPLTNDMLVFTGEVPESVTALGLTYGLVEPDGDFVLGCPGAERSEPLATGVDGVRSLSWPGTVLLAMDDGTAVALNIATGQRLEIGSADLPLENAQYVRNSPWFLSPANAAITDWRITNLKTMETMLLSDEIGGVLEEPILPSMVWSPGADTAIFSPTGHFFNFEPDPNDVPPNDPDATIAELPDGALVVDEALETRRWIDTWGRMALSPDGETIAYQTQIDLQPMVRVEETLTGEVLAEITDINFNYPSNALFAFAGDGETLVYLDEGEIRLASTRTPGDARTVETAGITVPGDARTVETAGITMPGDARPVEVYPTGVPGRVLIEFGAEGESLMYAANPVAILDTASGELTKVDGMAFKYGFVFAPESNDFDHIVTAKPSAEPGARTILQLVDVRTGEVVLASEPVEGSIETLTERGVAVNSDRSGETVVVSLTGEWALLFDLDSQSVASIPMEGLGQFGLPETDVFWTVMPSTDGHYLQAWGIHLPPDREASSSQQYLAMAMLAPLPDWRIVSDNVVSEGGGPRIALILAVPDQPSEEDEPAVLDAQEPVALDASPAVTPATRMDTPATERPENRENVTLAPVSTPLAATPMPEFHIGDCDLSADIPVLTGVEDSPFPDRMVLTLNNGELWLRCGDSGAALIEKGIEEVMPLAWPGALLLVTEDGVLRGVNFVTGARGDFGPEAVLYGPADGSESIVAPIPYAGGPAFRWMLLPATPEQTDWRFVDLETMESLLLSDLIGGVLPGSRVVLPYASSPDAIVIGIGGIPAFANAPPTDPFDPGGATPAPSTPVGELPSENAALVIDGSLDDTRWTETAPYPSLMPAAISPDGELLAIEHMTADGRLTVRVERLDTSELVAETGIAYGAGDSMALLDDGAGLPHLAENRLDLVTWDGGEVATETLLDFEPVEGARELVLTTEPGTVVVSLSGSPEGSPGWIVDTASGEVTEIPHLLHVPFVVVGYANDEPVGHVLTAAPSGPDGQRSTIRLIDVATGELVAESEPLDLPPAEAAMLEAALRDHGTIGFVFLEDGTTIALDAVAGEATMIPPPEGETSGGWFIRPSPTGDFLGAGLTTGDVYLMEMGTGEWLPAPPRSWVDFVPGSGADTLD